MKFFFLFLLPFVVYTQSSDSLLKPPKINLERLRNPINTEPEIVFEQWAKNCMEAIERIELVQIRPFCENGEIRETLKKREQVNNCHQETIIFSNKIFDTSKLYKDTAVAFSDFDDLFTVCFGGRESNMIQMCYNPRHAILFKNASDEIILIYEICFECGKAILSNMLPNYINIYDDDYIYLKKLFKDYGFDLN